MEARPRSVRALQRLALLTARPPFLRIWARAYRLLAMLAARYLTRGEPGATAHLHGRSGGEDLLPGLSDIDLTIVLAEDTSAAKQRILRRWERLGAGTALVDRPWLFGQAELRELEGHSVLTLPTTASAYLGGRASLDRVRYLERPGLYGAATARDARELRAAAWLELVYWWRWVFVACVRPTEPRATDMCLKFVGEPVRIWLWLAQGERVATYADVVRRGIDLMPQEERALRWALDARRRLPRTTGEPFAIALPAMARISALIAAELAAAAEGPPTQVRLESPPASGPRPLVDWRALACPLAADETFDLIPGDGADAAQIGRLAPSGGPGGYAALRAGDLMTMPALPFLHSRMRGVQSAVTDPVSFALARGGSTAEFSGVPGFSAADFAARAVTEQAKWLTVPTAADGALGTLFCAARAALFAESLEQGEPVLTLTVVDTARRLAERSAEARAVAEEAAGAFADRRAAPETVEALRALVAGLPAFASGPLSHAQAR